MAKSLRVSGGYAPGPQLKPKSFPFSCIGTCRRPLVAHLASPISASFLCLWILSLSFKMLWTIFISVLCLNQFLSCLPILNHTEAEETWGGADIDEDALLRQGHDLDPEVKESEGKVFRKRSHQSLTGAEVVQSPRTTKSARTSKSAKSTRSERTVKSAGSRGENVFNWYFLLALFFNRLIFNLRIFFLFPSVY